QPEQMTCARENVFGRWRAFEGIDYSGCAACAGYSPVQDLKFASGYHAGMTKPIVQSVKFNASAEELYAIYMDPKLHAEVTGSPVKISAKAGGKFTAFGGMLWGSTLVAVPSKLIVQAWRSKNFNKGDLDSV